jgi:hypothetical protein
LFCKEIEVLRGGVRLYVASKTKIDAARRKSTFPTETSKVLLNFTGRLIFAALFFIAAGCATPTARYKTESEQALERIRASNVATFPNETIDFFQTVNGRTLNS